MAHPPHRLRILGGIYLLVESGLSAAMVYIIYALAYVMRLSGDPGVKGRFNGTALQAVMVFGIFSFPLLVGFTVVLMGRWQLRYGWRNLKPAKVAFVWFYVLIGASLLIQGANLLMFISPRREKVAAAGKANVPGEEIPTMQSPAATVEEYLTSLPEERREALSAVRETILSHLGEGFEEGMQYGMIGYYVPHRLYPAGYHCSPKEPLPFAALASQKNYMAVYLSCVYGSEAETTWFREAYLATGKKLDMGKSCIRFKRLADLPVELIGEAIARVSVEQFVARYEAVLAATKSRKK